MAADDEGEVESAFIRANPYRHCNKQYDMFMNNYAHLPYDNYMCFEFWKYATEYDIIRFMMESQTLSYIMKHTSEAQTRRRKLEFDKFLATDGSIHAWLVSAGQFLEDYTRSRPRGAKNVDLDEASRKNERGKFDQKKLGFGNRLNEWKAFLKVEDFPGEMDLERVVRERLSERLAKYVWKEDTKSMLISFASLLPSEGNKIEKNNIKKLKGMIDVLEEISPCIGQNFIQDAVRKVRKHVNSSWNIGNNQKSNLSEPQAIQPRSIPLQECGPFGTQPVAIDYQDDYMMIDLEHNHFKVSVKDGRGSDRLDFWCRLSSIAETLVHDNDERTFLQVPPEATSYCFVYPCIQVDESMKIQFERVRKNMVELSKDPRNVSLALLLEYGGFMYLDNNHTPLIIFALRPGGQSYYFAGPKECENVEKEFPGKHLQEVFDDELRKREVTHMAWMRPGEMGAGNIGGFMFKCHGPSGDKDIYYVFFSLLSSLVGNEIISGDHVSTTSSENQRVESDLGNMIVNFAQHLKTSNEDGDSCARTL